MTSYPLPGMLQRADTRVRELPAPTAENLAHQDRALCQLETLLYPTPSTMDN